MMAPRHIAPKPQPKEPWPRIAETPVVCIFYNRSRLARAAVDRLRQVRPRQILIVADGPKRDNIADVEACDEVRSEIDRIDWDCTVHRNYADTNMGCRARILSGLNWAFSLVDRAIILEDDIDVDPRFFGWAARMLAAYEHRDDVAMLAGHNPLVWWPDVLPSSAGVPSRRGGIYGWATWRRAWHAVQTTSVSGPARMSSADVAVHNFEPALAALLSYYLERARETTIAWDVEWSLLMAISGRVAIVSPVNLVHNLGLGPDATITKDDDDMLFFLPRATAPDKSIVERLLAPVDLKLLPIGAVDRSYDRARILMELLVCARNPGMAGRLARRSELPLDAATRLHLLPFRHAEETRRWLEHLADAGADVNAIMRWRHALALAANAGPASTQT